MILPLSECVGFDPWMVDEGYVHEIQARLRAVERGYFAAALQVDLEIIEDTGCIIENTGSNSYWMMSQALWTFIDRTWDFGGLRRHPGDSMCLTQQDLVEAVTSEYGLSKSRWEQSRDSAFQKGESERIHYKGGYLGVEAGAYRILLKPVYFQAEARHCPRPSH